LSTTSNVNNLQMMGHGHIRWVTSTFVLAFRSAIGLPDCCILNMGDFLTVRQTVQDFC